ncbi:heavy metal translocating P-type ATPase [Acaricomes phytoseiuli]|uniref:heavy metal translocating P-type ATPase n=1 Tax=Acaricomes phytoseiuli TaxID=291968 RepID=UPI002223BB57|nr:heavy metal translocating P-type ATPase [Acaricomes phytoseiuli]MCW1249941.1 heavy metal translocating P-type ATPase [Acaricomes phytoseiuli]
MSAHHDHKDNARWEMGFAIASGVTYLIGVVFEYFVSSPPALPLAFFLATYFFGGFFTFSSAWRSVRNGRFEVDFLMLVAAIGAAAVGKFAEGAVLLFLFSLGHALEEYAMGRAKRSIEALAELAPPVALVLTDNGVVERPTEELEPGEVILVKPNSRIPADGVVVRGSSAVDQSAITGESIPVDKVPADSASAAVDDSSKVFAGTVNGAGSLEVRVTNAAKDSTLSRVVAMVRDADSTKSTTQRFIDRFQKFYVPAVLAFVAAVSLFGWLVLNEPLADSFYRSMLVLVAASPCALAIATPAAVLAGVARAAKAGLLVKGGAALENLGRVKAIAFDKTGTLTWGQPQLTDVVPAEGVSREELAAVALAVESESDHPLAGAIARGLDAEVPQEGRGKVEDLQAVTGRGVQGKVAGELVRIGSLRMFEEDGGEVDAGVLEIVQRLQGEGRTTMVVESAGRQLGVLGVMDSPRDEAREVLGVLRDNGISQLVMISGDNQRVAEAVGAQVGVDTAHGELMPEDKVAAIGRLTAQQQDGKPVLTAMVGDGVNDAPAMANATVGIAMGAAGSAVALETADVALMSDDLGRVPYLIRLSRASSKIIRQNLIASLVIVAFLIPASLMGLAMGPVVFIHEGSTLIVVANALRLLRFGIGKEHEGIEHENRPALTAAK